jgi:hypothetical protein
MTTIKTTTKWATAKTNMTLLFSNINIKSKFHFSSDFFFYLLSVNFPKIKKFNWFYFLIANNLFRWRSLREREREKKRGKFLIVSQVRFKISCFPLPNNFQFRTICNIWMAKKQQTIKSWLIVLFLSLQNPTHSWKFDNA